MTLSYSLWLIIFNAVFYLMYITLDHCRGGYARSRITFATNNYDYSGGEENLNAIKLNTKFPNLSWIFRIKVTSPFETRIEIAWIIICFTFQ